MKFTFALLFCCLSLASDVSAATAGPAVPAPTPLAAAARVARAEYCFAVDRHLRPDRNPPPTLVLRLYLDVSYSNTTTQPIILPWQYERTVYTAPMPGVMKPIRENRGVFGQTVDMMTRLPPNVSPANPVDPENDEFRIIPPHGHIALPIDEHFVAVTVHRDGRSKVDYLGKTLYLRLKLGHRPMAPNLEAELSDKWTRFGVPWTGNLLTNTLVIRVPASPAAADCVDKRYPDEGKDIDPKLRLQHDR